ncbi:MAG TPA: LysR family transcriptional regulator [Burkholderiales bacterium]|nr:LysR family transcriptional regulator [Burkholderiales bacterium]
MRRVYPRRKSKDNPNSKDILSAMKLSSVPLLVAFAEAAKRGSFARAARELHLSPSAVAKSVQRLEQHLKLRLFQRTTRRVTLTQEGAALYERSRRVLGELAELELSAAGAAAAPSGVLRVDAPIVYGRQVLVPLAASLARRHPALGLDLRLSDRFADVIGEGLDAAIRVGRIADSRLVALPVGEQQMRLYASPAYFASRKTPRTLRELKRHDCVVFRNPTSGRERPWEFRQQGRAINVQPPARYIVDDGEGLVAAAVAGLGLVQVPDYLAQQAVRDGRLKEALAELRPPPVPISLVYASRRNIPVRLRALIDALRPGAASPEAT